MAIAILHLLLKICNTDIEGLGAEHFFVKLLNNEKQAGNDLTCYSSDKVSRVLRKFTDTLDI